MAAGTTWAGTMPACASSASRRGLSLARTSSGLAEAIGDAPFGEVIRGHFDHDLVAGEHADAILAHLSRGMGDNFVAVLQEHPEGGVGQQLADRAFKFQQFFLGHSSSSKCDRKKVCSGFPSRGATTKN